MSRVIVTGVGGFIGHHVVKKLKDTGYEVIGITKISSKNEPDVDNVHKIGLSSQEQLNGIIKENDIVIHLAWSTVPASSESDSEKDVITNIPASLNLIEACARKKHHILYFFHLVEQFTGTLNTCPLMKYTLRGQYRLTGSINLWLKSIFICFHTVLVCPIQY